MAIAHGKKRPISTICSMGIMQTRPKQALTFFGLPLKPHIKKIKSKESWTVILHLDECHLSVSFFLSDPAVSAGDATLALCPLPPPLPP